MKILSLLKHPPTWAVALTSSLGGALLAGIAALWVSYGDFRAKKVEQNNTSIEQSVQSILGVKPTLEKFIATMNGKSTPNLDDKAKLTAAIRLAHDRAEDTRNRLGGLDGEFDALAKSLVELKDASENLTGPLDGKQFFVALSKWYVAEENWRRAVQRKQNSYLAYLGV